MLLLQVLQGHFSQLKHRLLACEPADFSLGKDCDWNVGFPVGALHQTQAALLLGCLEVLIEDVVAEATGTAAKPLCSALAALAASFTRPLLCDRLPSSLTQAPTPALSDFTSDTFACWLVLTRQCMF